MMIYFDKLNSISKKNNSLLCIGLDVVLEKIPQVLKRKQFPILEFNREIIDATHDLVCAYKPNLAFYSGSGGLAGLLQLKKTIDYIHQFYPEIPVIIDAKIGDIDNTNQAYCQFIFDYLQADATTVNPYLGKVALKPFLNKKDKGIYILCRTSNDGAGEFQDLLLSKSQPADSAFVATSAKEGTPLYQIIAQHVVKDWNYNGNCGLVVGATYPAELKIVRRIGSKIPILIPGIGAQGGDLQKTVKFGVDKRGQNAVINSARNIIFASTKDDFAQKAREEATKLKREINKYRFI